MRINRLDLTRFGPFTDCTLDLSEPGVHLIVGANEAGKTTAMDAIRQLLYGIPVRSTHAFLHALKDLTLGAQLLGEDGATHEIVRVKKRNDTLRDAAGNTLGEGLLTKLLYDVTQEVYASLFTIGHQELAAGGAALLSSDGEVGRALFSASRGTTDLAAVMRKLDERAADLFKNAGSKPALNAAIREFKDASDEAKRLSKSASEVVGLDSKLASAQKEQDRIDAERKQLAQRKTRLQQVHSNRPQLASRHDAMIRRDQLAGQGPLVEPEVHEQLEAARAERATGQTAKRAAQAAIDRLEQKLAKLTLDSALLDQRERVEQLQTATGGYELNQKDLPGLKARATTLERELQDLRRQLPAEAPLDEQGRSTLSVDQARRIEQLAEQRSKLDSDLEHAVDALEETAADLTSHRAQLERLDEPADVAALGEVTARLRKAGDLESKRDDVARRLATADATLEADLAALGFTDTDARNADSLAVPSLEAIRGLRAAFDKLAGDIERLEDDIDELEAQQTGENDSLTELLRREHPPTLDELDSSRTRRDTGWRLIRDAWLNASDNAVEATDWSQGKPLPDAYESAVEGADDVADRLRVDADDVERRATLERKIESITNAMQSRRDELSEKRSAHDAAETAWAELWAPHGITPESRSAMEGWRDRFRMCAEQAAHARQLNDERAEHDHAIARHVADLTGALEASLGESPGTGLSLLGLLDLAEQLAATAIRSQQDHAAATKDCAETDALLAKHTAARDRSQQAMADWRATWEQAVTAAGLTAAASPAEAKDVLEVLSQIEIKATDLQDKTHRIGGIETRDASFTDEVSGVLSALEDHADVVEADPGAAVRMLSRRLKEALAVEATESATTEERENNQEALDAAELKVAAAESAISDLVEAAAVADEAALSDAISRSEAHTDIVDEIAKLESALRKSAGKPMDQIELEEAEFTGVEIDPEIQQLDLALEAVDEQLKLQATTVGELTNQRSQIDDSGAAADQMTLAQQSLAAVADYADEYVQTVLARQLLEEQVNAYREQHQGPLLSRARELFRKLTLDAYLGLDTDTNDKGEPFLQALKADDTLLEIAALSTGTRDQLYLALRMAALEQFMERRGPLPLVLDDLFVHFDDQRTKAGLAVLHDLSQSTQVLLFTHHRQVAVQAAEVIDKQRLWVHELG